MLIEEAIKDILRQAVSKISADQPDIILETPRQAGFGDYATPVAMQLAKKLGKNPREIATAILAHIPTNDLIEKTEVAGAGFINLTLTPSKVEQAFFAFDPATPLVNPNPRKIEVEFGNPNIAKPLHFGHFRGLIIGEALARLLRYVGHDVLTDNFIGDWGTQFGKLIVAIRKWGDRGAIDKNPTEELVRLYRKFHDEAENNPELEKEGAEEFRKMEQEKNAENLELWKWIVGESMKDFFSIAGILDAHFDVIRGESFYEPLLTDVIKKLEDSGAATREPGGALIVEFPEATKLPTMIFQKTDGATLYQTRDLAKIIYYDAQGFDQMVYVVGSEQSLHFRQVFATAQMLGFTGNWIHANHGLVRLPEGRMSSRAGRTVGLDEVLDEAKKRALESLAEHNSETTGEEREELAEIIAIGALKFNDLGQNRRTDIIFKWEQMLDFNGYSGPFIQYSAVRCASILRKAGKLQITNDKLQLNQPAELSLAKKIIRFPVVVMEAAERLEPHILAEYLFQLAGEFNVFYTQCPVLKADEKEQGIRLLLTKKSAETLKQGLNLLGIKTPERM